MKISIDKSIANGIVTAPPSKSMAHRLIICAALCDGVSIIENVDYSQDIEATIDCIRTLGAKVVTDESTVTVDGRDTVIRTLTSDNNMSDKADISELVFNCRESGSTMRFFMGIAMTLPCVSVFNGSETLRNRPFGIYEKILNDEATSLANDKTFFERKPDKIVIKGAVKGNLFHN